MSHVLVRRTIFAAAATVATMTPAVPTYAAPAANGSGGVTATFEGGAIDLAEDWGDARACSISATGAVCYRSEAEMDTELAASKAALGGGEVAPLSSCSTSLRLYDGTSYTGQVVSISTRATLISLSSLGFDNKTSSYKVGACSATLYSGGGSGIYPGNTAANAQAPSMTSGWNNTISSVLLA